MNSWRTCWIQEGPHHLYRSSRPITDTSRRHELVHAYKHLSIEHIIERRSRPNRKWVPFFNCHFNNSDGVLNFCKNRDLDSLESIIKAILCYIPWTGRYSRHTVPCWFGGLCQLRSPGGNFGDIGIRPWWKFRWWNNLSSRDGFRSKIFVRTFTDAARQVMAILRRSSAFIPFAYLQRGQSSLIRFVKMNDNFEVYNRWVHILLSDDDLVNKHEMILFAFIGDLYKLKYIEVRFY